ncbi:MAG: hypothetical protein EON54_28770 [Alcaligenaceae bacterium]|nr:MAG: hypothetical protein EON54_28770 [Alcaligenaceae bacterium]
MKAHLLWLVMACSPWAAWSGTATSRFEVKLELQYREKCVSETLGQQTNAVVQVVCGSGGNFVTIDPAPGKPFLGTHGGAFRYYFRLGHRGVTDRGLPLVGLDGDVNPYIGYGTVTGLRVFNSQGVEDPFEFLISY